MGNTRQYFILSFSIFLVVLSSFIASAWTTGSQIEVKMDADGGSELWTFRLTSGAGAIYVIEEDGWSADEKCTVSAIPNKVLQRNGRLSDIAASIPSACNDGGSGNSPAAVMGKQFGSSVRDHCEGRCTLSPTGNSFSPIGDLYRTSNNIWVLCDASEDGNSFEDVDGVTNLTCSGGEFTFASQPGEVILPPNPGSAGPDRCQQYLDKNDCTNISLDPANADCGWCAKPYSDQPTVNSRGGGGSAFDGTAVPYYYPTDTHRNMQFGCFNVRWGDPFNCGGCGIKTIDEDTLYPKNPIEFYPNDNNAIFDYDHFCVGDFGGGNPYCNGNSCQSTPASTEWLSVAAGAVNPFYSYSVAPENGGHKSIGTSGATGPAYTISEIDASSAACRIVAGSDLPVNSVSDQCCGDGKPRYGAGNLCQEEQICDGYAWHDARVEDGKVFRLPTVYQNPYPIAAVNGIFTQCVDAADYDALLVSRASNADDQKGCVPGVSTEGHGAAELDYYCPTGYGFAGGNHVGSENGANFICRNSFLVDSATKFIPGAGKFFCVAARPGEVMAQAFLFADSAKHWPFDASTSGDASRCPGVITTGWNYNDQMFNLISTIGCPGMVDVQVDDGAYPGVFGNANGFGSFRAGVCLPFKPAAERNMKGYFNQLNFVPNNNTYLGAVNGHGYLCTARPGARPAGGTSAVVAICCGNSTTGCGADIPGTREAAVSQQYTAGQFINLTDANNNYRMYCKSDGSWGVDLDNDRTACLFQTSGGSVAYTGMYCCSEGGDDAALINGVTFREFYNDPNGTGACYNSVYQRNNEYLRINNTNVLSVIVTNGSFLGCRPDPSINSSFTPISRVNWPNPGSTAAPAGSPQLINYQAACTLTNFKNSQYVCGVDGNWAQSSTNRSSLSTIPAPLMSYFRAIRPNSTLKPAECCLQSQCWDPLRNQCINEQTGVNQFYNTTNGDYYRCMGGIWGTVDDLKATPDNCNIGLCPQPSQCLINPSGNAAQNGNTSGNPQCINSGQYMGDALCVNGSWDSRTRVAAAVLSKFVGSSDDYVISCGEANKVLLNPQNPGSINSVCVMDFKPGTAANRRLFATSLNQEIDVPSGSTNLGRDYTYALRQSFLLSYPGINLAASCLTATDSSIPCISGTNSGQDLIRVYYDQTNKVVLFSDRPISGLSPTWYSAVCAGLPPWLSWVCPAPAQLESNLKNITFTRMYSAKVAGKEELGTLKDNVCLCRGCTKQDEYVFSYKGYSLSDISSVVGPAALYQASNFTLTETGTGASAVVRLIIRNPVGIDTDSAWRALSFLKAGN